MQHVVYPSPRFSVLAVSHLVERANRFEPCDVGCARPIEFWADFRVMGVFSDPQGTGDLEVLGESFIQPKGDTHHAGMENGVRAFMAKVFGQVIALVRENITGTIRFDEHGPSRRDMREVPLHILVIGALLLKEIDVDRLLRTADIEQALHVGLKLNQLAKQRVVRFHGVVGVDQEGAFHRLERPGIGKDVGGCRYEPTDDHNESDRPPSGPADCLRLRVHDAMQPILVVRSGFRWRVSMKRCDVRHSFVDQATTAVWNAIRPVASSVEELKTGVPWQ